MRNLLLLACAALFAGMVAERHDGFSMWDSNETPFCAAKMGPKRDVVGELGKAIKAHVPMSYRARRPRVARCATPKPTMRSM